MTGITAIVLAAGMGTRMKSKTLKCLHKIAGLPMMDHLLAMLADIDASQKILVISEEMKEKLVFPPDVKTVVQKERLGTGHAVMQAKEYFLENSDDVVVVYGDNPLIRAETINEMISRRREGMSVVVLGFDAKDPARYGRLVVDENGFLDRIVEFKDATNAEKKITLCNSGVMCFDGSRIAGLLSEITNDNKAGEYYLTDAVAIAKKNGLKVGVVIGDEEEMQGVNSRYELAKAESNYQKRRRRELMDNGVTLIDPNTVYVSYDTEIAPDVVIEPNVFFGPHVKIESDVTVKAFSHIEGATIKSGAVIGPFARLRPGAVIENDAHIGDFVEIKNSVIGKKSKVNHLSYIGDTDMGGGTNIGAGTITCNYDGYFKHRTVIGDNVFIGSHTCMVAPVVIGNGAFTAAGSTVTRNVPDDALAVARAVQTVKEGWAADYHKTKRELKAKQKK